MQNKFMDSSQPLNPKFPRIRSKMKVSHEDNSIWSGRLEISKPRNRFLIGIWWYFLWKKFVSTNIQSNVSVRWTPHAFSTCKSFVYKSCTTRLWLFHSETMCKEKFSILRNQPRLIIYTSIWRIKYYSERMLTTSNFKRLFIYISCIVYYKQPDPVSLNYSTTVSTQQKGLASGQISDCCN